MRGEENTRKEGMSMVALQVAILAFSYWSAGLPQPRGWAGTGSSHLPELIPFPSRTLGPSLAGTRGHFPEVNFFPPGTLPPFLFLPFHSKKGSWKLAEGRADSHFPSQAGSGIYTLSRKTSCLRFGFPGSRA